MRRRRPARLTAAAIALVLCAAGCASGSTTTSSTPATSGPGAGSSSPTTTTSTGGGAPPRGGPSALTVSPASGSPHSIIRFSFTSPAGAADARTQVSQSLSIIGPQHTGCVGVHEEAVPAAPAGRAVAVSVGPAQLGGARCPGTYAARVEVLARPKCGSGMMCPQFIRVVAVLGPATFRITG